MSWASATVARTSQRFRLAGPAGGADAAGGADVVEDMGTLLEMSGAVVRHYYRTGEFRNPRVPERASSIWGRARYRGTRVTADERQGRAVDDASATALADVPARRPGRRRDDTKDDAILEAARELLAERGFDGMTMDAVAERAGAGKATLYRRWPSKVLLTVDAIVCGPGARMTIDDVPDTGTLRGDLLAVRFGRRRDDDNALMSGLMPVIKGDPQLATVFHEQFVRTRVVLMRALLERARLRGELRADVDLDMVATVPPAMISYRKVIEGGYVDEEFVVRMIDSVILPLVVDTSADTSTPTTADAGAASTA
ncbi:hypothetical protein Cch01nite_23770 [Cellulomonas chitinilytica]|uniref:HTH tetR-type domain-containing protein n=1 Tax=Cellulomonas chitinilytica TaxID=398759 RepID=A0A919U081_9CELL|nr:hypothetical protein Cch01nite_23770 [Cellulomonas chitinilytica]